MSLKARIEAVLFLTDKPLRAQAIARIVNEDVQVVRQTILELIHDYESRQSGLEIADDDGYIAQVKDEYSSIINEFVPMELPMGLLRTLSAIAIKQPIPQSEIIKIRGATAYDHIKELVERELISKKEEGRSPLLSTTKKFQEYFRLSQDAKSLRHELQGQIDEQLARAKAESDAALEAAGESAIQLRIETPLPNQTNFAPEEDIPEQALSETSGSEVSITEAALTEAAVAKIDPAFTAATGNEVAITESAVTETAITEAAVAEMEPAQSEPAEVDETTEAEGAFAEAAIAEPLTNSDEIHA